MSVPEGKRGTVLTEVQPLSTYRVWSEGHTKADAFEKLLSALERHGLARIDSTGIAVAVTIVVSEIGRQRV